MAQPQLLRHMGSHGRRAIALGGMVARGNKGGAGLTRQMGLGLGDFTRDIGISPCGQRAFKEALRATRAPGQTAYGLVLRTADAGHGTAQHLLHMVCQGSRTGKTGITHHAQRLLAKGAVPLYAELGAQLRVVPSSGWASSGRW